MSRLPPGIYHDTRKLSQYTCEGCGHKMMGGRQGIRETGTGKIHLFCPACWDILKEMPEVKEALK